MVHLDDPANRKEETNKKPHPSCQKKPPCNTNGIIIEQFRLPLEGGNKNETQSGV
jgi:hypothetical protein